MVELIEEIVRAEAEAEELIRTARQRAAEEKRTLEESLAARLAAAKETATREAAERIELARAEFSAARPIASPRTDVTAFLEEHRAEVDAVVAAIVHLVLSTELDRTSP
jgi:vacuolar-type H+-ATPase subunit H